jgi:hypothetical protein
VLEKGPLIQNNVCAAELLRQRPNFLVDFAEIICQKLATLFVFGLCLCVFLLFQINMGDSVANIALFSDEEEGVADEILGTSR